MSFAENMLFLGSLRTGAGGDSGIFKYDLANLSKMTLVGHVVGRPDRGTDDQFSLPIGNLLVVADDQHLFGAYLAVHATARDQTPPDVLYVNPPNGSTKQALTSRIGLSFSDQIELTSATPISFIVRPVGGAALTGRWGISHTVLSFWPDRPLAPSTTYEIVLPAGGIKDLVGNGIAHEFRSTFTTQDGSIVAPPCGLALASRAPWAAWRGCNRPTPPPIASPTPGASATTPPTSGRAWLTPTRQLGATRCS